jgi:hypothetical protein
LNLREVDEYKQSKIQKQQVAGNNSGKLTRKSKMMAE